MYKSFIMFITSLVFLTGCSTIQVDTDYDVKYSFDALKTFTISNDDTKQIDSLTADRIQSALISSLQSKGYKISTDNNDAKVSFYLTKSTFTRTDSNVQIGAGFGPYRRLGMGMSVPLDSTTRTYDEGKLTIDIIDTKTNKLIWRGVGQDTLKSFSTPEKKTEYINQVINDILKKFPPKH